ncbi:hypothetical protein [Streptococcus suis]|uniref:hypothetical protein n=1 Tax=Streptococcus suis TaxID=1307 RepID=UPI0013749FBE|nr:hypothetical protein [Streptococcus suis]MBY4969598.1 hypothetical protein [Streptococcus suis]MBY4980734.1 hypothetical protein [Streptococcus suis]HEL2684709.1 hypothetical protein [Streptococcus suis]
MSRKPYQASDKFLVISRIFINYLVQEYGIILSGISFLPQYGEEPFQPKFDFKE